MSTKRMQSRILSARVMDSGYLHNKRLVFNKRSKDGSGKANLVHSSNDITWGVLYSLERKDLVTLDRIEQGYARHSLEVRSSSSQTYLAEVYISTILTEDAIAFDWYKDLLIAGAYEHKLPVDYIEFLCKLPSKAKKQN